MVHYSNSSLGGALKSPGKNRPFALTFACHGEKTIPPGQISSFLDRVNFSAIIAYGMQTASGGRPSYGENIPN